MENTIKNVTLENIEKGLNYLIDDYRMNAKIYRMAQFIYTVDGSEKSLHAVDDARNDFLIVRNALRGFGVDVAEIENSFEDAAFYKRLRLMIRNREYIDNPALIEKIACEYEKIADRF